MPVMASSGAVTTKRVKRWQTKWHSYRLVALEHNEALGLVTETWERQADLEPQLGPLELCDADGGGREDPDLLPADAAAQEGGSQEWSSSWAWSGTESRTAKAKAKGKAAQPKPKAKKGTAASGAKAQPKRPAKKPSKQ